MLSDKQLRFLHAKPYNKLTKKQALQLGLHDADRRYEIGVSKMSEITKRVHELEVERNQALRRNLIISELEKTDSQKLKEHLRKELYQIDNSGLDMAHYNDKVYHEVAIGYKPMSRRKNELQEERNLYVKDIEALSKK